MTNEEIATLILKNKEELDEVSFNFNSTDFNVLLSPNVVKIVSIELINNVTQEEQDMYFAYTVDNNIYPVNYNDVIKLISSEDEDTSPQDQFPSYHEEKYVKYKLNKHNNLIGSTVKLRNSQNVIFLNNGQVLGG